VAQVRARVWWSGICSGQVGAGIGFLRVLRFPLPIFILTNSPSSQSPGVGTIRQKWPACRVDPVWTPTPTMRIKKIVTFNNKRKAPRPISCISTFYTQVDMLCDLGVEISFCNLDPVWTLTEIYSVQSETRQFSQTSILSYFHQGSQHLSPSSSYPTLHLILRFALTPCRLHIADSTSSELWPTVTHPTNTATCLDGLITTNILHQEYTCIHRMVSTTKWGMNLKKSGRISSCVSVVSRNLNLLLLHT
jgi:hypothetical protein